LKQTERVPFSKKNAFNLVKISVTFWENRKILTIEGTRNLIYEQKKRAKSLFILNCFIFLGKNIDAR